MLPVSTMACVCLDITVSRKAEGEHNGHHGWKTPLTEGWSLSLAVF